MKQRRHLKKDRHIWYNKEESSLYKHIDKKKMVSESWDCNEKEFDFCDFSNAQQTGAMGMKTG